MAGYCVTCDDRCFLLCEEDLFGGVTPLSQRLPFKKRQAMMWEAQAFYVEDLLGDCLGIICDALRKANLASEDEEYEAIPNDWLYKKLIVNYIKPLLVKATTLLYIRNYGFEDLDVRLEAREERESFVANLEGYVMALQQQLQNHLVQNSEVYACPCPALTLDENPAFDAGSWLSSTKYPHFGILDEEQRC